MTYKNTENLAIVSFMLLANSYLLVPVFHFFGTICGAKTFIRTQF